MSEPTEADRHKERLLFGGVICRPCDGVGHTYAPRGTVTGEAPPGYGDNYLKCRACGGTGFEQASRGPPPASFMQRPENASCANCGTRLKPDDTECGDCGFRGWQ